MDLRRMTTLVNTVYFKRIFMAGMGATGSKLFDLLIRAGFDPAVFNLYDPDIVEAHNMCNQIFTTDHVSMPKVIAAKNIACDITGKHSANVTVGRFELAHLHLIDDKDNLFVLATDDNDFRKRLLNEALVTSIKAHIICPVIGIDSGEVVYLNLSRSLADKDYLSKVARYIEGIPSTEEIKKYEVLSPCKERQDCNAVSTLTAAIAAQTIFSLTQNKSVSMRQLFSLKDGLEGVSS